MSEPGRWSDLLTRLVSAVVMMAVGFGAVALGGSVFQIVIALVCGAMTWELARMFEAGNPSKALLLGLLTAGAVIASQHLPTLPRMAVLLAPAVVGAVVLPRYRLVFAGFTALGIFAGYELISLRQANGLVWLLWLILVVIASDVAGYFAGKSLGGPKFWPRVSPKKTWSGTAAGWVAAGVIGLIFALSQDASLLLVPFSVLVALAAQMGDIGESAIKRMVGVKDSSALIPGHGGVLDRFDGMLGASVFVFLIGPIASLPPVAL